MGVGQGQFSSREGYREARDKGNFINIIFEFNKSRAQLSHQLKTHVRDATSIWLMSRLLTC